VSEWQVTFLGVMAGALVLMALAQAAVAFALFRSVKHVLTALDDLKREVHPLVEKAHRIADDAARVSAMAVVQAERIDALVQQTTAAQQSVSGVNLDEEAANLIRFQQAYQASGRVLQIASKLFDTILGIGS